MTAFRCRAIAMAMAAVLAAHAPAARADHLHDPTDSGRSDPATAAPDDPPSLSYLWTDGAIPFLWVALGARVVIDKYVAPRDTPLLFSSGEGGAASYPWEVPGWTVSLTAGVVGALMASGKDPAKWHHIKGLAESLATGALLTGVLKPAFGRHRPGWNPVTDTEGDRRSFPSGHATQAFAIATYTALYLRGHTFARFRDGNELPAYEVVTYAGLAVAATAVSAERVIHHRHHISDVAAGAALGTLTSVVFYHYQEHNARNHVPRERSSLTVLPMLDGDSAGVALSGSW
jgi:membrane-associated phospholipid phosphatase